MKHPSRTRKHSAAPLGASLVALSSLFYASYGIWTKLLGQYFSAFTQATIRHIITASMFLALAYMSKQIGKVHWRRDWRWFALSFVSSGIIPASQYYAYLHAGVGISSGLTYVGIVTGMYFFGWLFLRERFSRDKWSSTALAFVGLCLIFAPSIGSIGWLALLAGLGGGLGIGLNIVASKRMPYGALQTATIAWVLGVFANLPFIFILHEPTNVFHWNIAWLYLVGLAIVSVGASWSVIRGVKLIEAGAAGILSLLEIPFGVFFGFAFFGERPGLWVIAGMAAIVLAAAIPYIRDYNARKGTLEPA